MATDDSRAAPQEAGLMELLEKQREERQQRALRRAQQAQSSSSIFHIKAYDGVSGGEHVFPEGPVRTSSEGGIADARRSLPSGISRTASEGHARPGFCAEPGHQSFELNM